ncbi:S1 family peptidase [Microvirga lenta]|uniref:S1 family peptidase n=1 Tax=Microvirga lenta TaxID=2881337 RepID=UPI001D001506|nr:trypsin-like serine protease [Microvirga lenta]MCB5176285.1 trypsin-like serine protease [Microvirga lenta]
MKRLTTLLLACGLSATAAQAIVGGREDNGPLARQSVMVLSSNGGVCSAVVVAPDAVLTAAHCVTGAAEHRVHFRDESGEPVLIVPAAKAVHPAYDPKAIETRRRSIDLALLRIPEPLPDRFETATLGASWPAKNGTVVVGGYGLARRNDPKTTGTFRTASLTVIEPYGPSRILLWSKGTGAMGACQGDSGGPMASGDSVVAVTSWSTAAKGESCGDVTQGILVGPQRQWIDQTLASWRRSARWNGAVP